VTFTTRFAPSPTGPLHLGHAFSALTAWDMAQAAHGQFLLRIEDIDRSRARPEWEAQIYDDLHWLGLHWPLPVLRQSDRLPIYGDALQRLWNMGLLYPCTCNRRDIAAAASAPQEGAPQVGPDGIVYPGTCRTHPRPAPMPGDSALRLDMAKALDTIDPADLRFTETGPGLAGSVAFNGKEILTQIGDVALARREMGTSYHLSVVIDDADQHISHVVRGRDLFDATRIHVLLQCLLGLPVPTYHHHALIRDQAGKRLAKRDDARAISQYRLDGVSSQEIRQKFGL